MVTNTLQLRILSFPLYASMLYCFIYYLFKRFFEGNIMSNRGGRSKIPSQLRYHWGCTISGYIKTGAEIVGLPFTFPLTICPIVLYRLSLISCDVDFVRN